MEGMLVHESVNVEVGYRYVFVYSISCLPLEGSLCSIEDDFHPGPS